MLNKANCHGNAQQQYKWKELFKALNLDPVIHGSDPVKIVMDIARKIQSKAVDNAGNRIKIELRKRIYTVLSFSWQQKKKLI